MSPNKQIPKCLFLTKVTVSSFSFFIRPFYIDAESNLLISSLAISSIEIFRAKIYVGSSGFLSVILSQDRSVPLTVLFRLWTFVFTGYDSSFFLEPNIRSILNSLYKEMKSSSNQKRNIWIHLGIPDWLFDITLVVSDIKYFLYGTNSLFTSFLCSKCLLLWTFVFTKYDFSLYSEPVSVQA